MKKMMIFERNDDKHCDACMKKHIHKCSHCIPIRLLEVARLTHTTSVSLCDKYSRVTHFIRTQNRGRACRIYLTAYSLPFLSSLSLSLFRLNFNLIQWKTCHILYATLFNRSFSHHRALLFLSQTDNTLLKTNFAEF